MGRGAEASCLAGACFAAVEGGGGRVQERVFSLEDGGQPLKGKTPGGSPQPNEDPVEKSQQQQSANGSSATINIKDYQLGFSAAKPSLSGRHPCLSTTARKLPEVPRRSRPQFWHPSRPLWSCRKPRVCVGSETVPD